MNASSNLICNVLPIVFICITEDVPILFGKTHRHSANELVPLTDHFHHAYHQQKKIKGENIAIKYYNNDTKHFTNLPFRDLDHFSTIIAKHIKSLVPIDEERIRNGERIIFAFRLPPSEKMILIIFAILKTGAAYLPLDCEYSEAIIHGIVARFRPQLIIHEKHDGFNFETDHVDDDEFPLKVATIEGLWEILVESLRTNPTPLKRNKQLQPMKPYPFIVKSAPTVHERLAVVFCTTRITSGNPKGVCISQMNIINRISWSFSSFAFAQIRKIATYCLTDPITSVQSLSQVFTPLLQGATLCIMKADVNTEEEMSNFIPFLNEAKIGRICLSLPQFHMFLDVCSKSTSIALNHLKTIICRGAILKEDIVAEYFKRFEKSNKEMYSLFGHPEITGDLFIDRYKNQKDLNFKAVGGRLLFGTTVANTRIYVLDSQLNLVGEEVQGQICISGLCLAMGYFDEADSKGVFVDNPFKDEKCSDYDRLYLSGDYGRFIRGKDGQLRLKIEGRMDELVQHQGHEINLDDVKQMILTLDEIEYCHLQVMRLEAYDQNLVAFVLVEDEPDIGKAMYIEMTINMRLREILPYFMLPETRTLFEIPKLFTGRVDASLLLSNYEEFRSPNYHDWDELGTQGLPESKWPAAMHLLEGLYKFCSIPVSKSIASLQSSAFQLGCDSCSGVALYEYLKDERKGDFHISYPEFLYHKSLNELINKMTFKRNSRVSKSMCGDVIDDMSDFNDCYSLTPLEQRHRRAAIHYLAKAYTEKGELEKYNMIKYEDFVTFLQSNWDEFIKSRLCACCEFKWGFGIAGVMICTDFFTDLDLSKVKGGLRHFADFSSSVKAQFIHEISHEQNNTLEILFMATNPDMPGCENLKIIYLMMQHSRYNARSHGFSNVYIASPNRCAVDTGHKVLHWIILDEYNASRYENELTKFKPFCLAPNTVSLTALLFNTKDEECNISPSSSQMSFVRGVDTIVETRKRRIQFVTNLASQITNQMKM